MPWWIAGTACQANVVQLRCTAPFATIHTTIHTLTTRTSPAHRHMLQGSGAAKLLLELPGAQGRPARPALPADERPCMWPLR